MRIAKTVMGIYVLEGDAVVEREAFAREALPDILFEDHPFEEAYGDADRAVLPLERIAEISGATVDEVRERQVEAAQAYSRDAIREREGRDQLLVQAVRALEDIDEGNNELSERLRPWYRLHFPEMEAQMGDNEAFASQVAEEADRAEQEDLAVEESTGMELTSLDLRMLETFASYLSGGYVLRDRLERYVQQLAGEVVPNLAALLGEVLAARLLSEAGSLEKLAKMPSSTIQVLGAEKAMFRHMEGEGDAPKHGVLFMHEFVRNAPRGEQGKLARVLANKAAIAARIDQYGGDFKGDELRGEVEETFEDVR